MGKQIFSFKGMMRDLSVSKNPSNYAYEIRNMRLTAQEDSTLLSLVTEKGNREFAIKDSSGNPVTLDNIIGYCTVGKYLTVFTHGSTDSIVRLEEIKTATPSYMEAKILYQGNLNFEDSDGKVVEIDSLGCYENENIQKVYWVDGVNQPRLINITANDDEISNWGDMETPFDFIPALGFNETVDIKKVNYNGLFAPGTLQYALTYYKRNGQQSNVFYTSPMYYTSHSNRGASPEDSVSNAFEIKVYNPDTTFDFVRVYSMLSTSQDDAPVCKRVYDIPLKELSTEMVTTDIGFSTIISSEDYPVQSPIAATLSRTFIAKKIDNTTYKSCNMEDFLYSINDGYKRYLVQANSTSEYVVISVNSTGVGNNITGTVYTVSDFYIYITQTGIDTYEIGDVDESLSDWGLGELNQLYCTFNIYNYAKDVNYVTFIDNGLIGDSCSLEEIVYAGGQVIFPKTLSQKNNTLFLGNYKLSGHSFTERDKINIKNNVSVFFGYSDNEISKGELGSYYIYKNQLDLSSKEITTFKGGEKYLFGLIFQDKFGQWSDVVPLEEMINNLYPSEDDTSFLPVKAFIKINTEEISDIISDFVNVKVVMSNIQDSVICQGVLCPTVFGKNRELNKPYAQSSWYFRDVNAINVENNRPQARHYYNIVNNYTDNGSILSGEIQYASTSRVWYHTYVNHYEDIPENDRFVDWNIVTLNSPDIDFSTIKVDDVKVRVVGILPITGGVSSRSITFENLPCNYNDERVDPPGIMNYNNDYQNGYEIELCNYNYWDHRTDEDTDLSSVAMPIYPWHRTVSIHCMGTQNEDGNWWSTIDTKIMASLRTSSRTFFTNDKISYKLNDIKIFNKEDGLPKTLRNNYQNKVSMYWGNVDDLLVTEGPKSNYYKDTLGVHAHDHQSSAPATAVSMKYKSSSHAIMELMSETGTTLELLPNIAVDVSETQVPVDTIPVNDNYLTVPIIDIGTVTGNPIEVNVFSMVDWQGKFYPSQTHYTSMVDNSFYTMDISEQFPTYMKGNDAGLRDSQFSGTVNSIINNNNLHNGQFVIIKYNTNKMLLCKVVITSDSKVIRPLKYYSDFRGSNYINESYNNIEFWQKEFQYYNGEYKLKGNIDNYSINFNVKYYDNNTVNYVTFNFDLRLFKYQSYHWEFSDFEGWHWAKRFGGDVNHMYILTTDGSRYTLSSSPTVITTLTTHSPLLSVPTQLSNSAYMYLAELYIDNMVENDNNANYLNNWTPASMQFKIGTSTLCAELGDTYYQRYDCLKTFPYTHEDVNQIIEIFSFMCETRINIDGRYDQYRGLSDNTVISEERFNLCNMAYTQKDNIFSYHYLDSYLFSNDVFPNRILWTKTKNYGEEIDSWTQIQTISELDMDGVLGPVSTLRLFNDNLLCWQSKGFAKIQYNDRNAISTSSGVPVELANSGKVDGKTYISTEHGCDNMNTVQITPSGVYFTDSNTRDLMKYGQDGLFSLSKAKGFNSYMNSSVTDLKESKTFYDPKLQDIYFLNSCNSNIPQVFYFDEFDIADEYVVFDNKVLDLVIIETGYDDEIVHTNIELYREGKGVIDGTLVDLWSEGYRQLNDNSNKAVYTGNIIEINNVEYCIYAIYNIDIFPGTPNTAPVLFEDKIDENTPVYALVPKSYWKNYKTLKTCNNISEALITYYKFIDNSQYNGVGPHTILHKYLIDVESTTPKETLIFNEQLNEFTSFMDYDMDFLLPLQDSIISIKGNSLYKQFDGDYLTFFGSVKDYSVEFIANENPLADKIFTNLEFRADVINPNTGGLVGTSSTTANSANELPFSKIRVWNEYQDTGDIPLEQMIRRGVNMSQRFRIWRCDIPRDSTKKLDRIRNMWAKVKLSNTGKAFKTVLHDVNVIYYQ